jgi:hypothetical protein
MKLINEIDHDFTISLMIKPLNNLIDDCFIFRIIYMTTLYLKMRFRDFSEAAFSFSI